MEVKNGIIIDGVLHEATNIKGFDLCKDCSLVNLCCEEEKPAICKSLFDRGIFIDRGKVKIEKGGISMDITTGEEFENFMSFTIKYKITKKFKKGNNRKIRFAVPFSQLKKKADSLKITEEKFKEKAIQYLLNEEEASIFTRLIFHPTEEDIEDDNKHCQYLLEKGVNFETLQEKLSSDPLFEGEDNSYKYYVK